MSYSLSMLVLPFALAALCMGAGAVAGLCMAAATTETKHAC